MRLPPLGFVLPLLTAVGVAVSLMPESVDLAPLSFVEALPVVNQVATQELPPVSDATAARAVFSTRPLLAERREVPVPPHATEPPMQSALQDEVFEMPEPEPLPTPLPATPPLLTLTGLILVDGTARALLRDINSQTEVWGEIGDVFGEWTLVEITQVAAILEAAGLQVTIQMFEEKLP